MPTIRGAGDARFRVSASAPGLAAGTARVGGVGVPAGTWALFPPAAGRPAQPPSEGAYPLRQRRTGLRTPPGLCKCILLMTISPRARKSYPPSMNHLPLSR